MTTTKDLAEALRELIALKDLKEGAMERSIKASMSKGANPSERYHEWNADYKRRKPLAWEAARAALASHDAAQSAGEAPVPVAWQLEDGSEFFMGAKIKAASLDPDVQALYSIPLYTHPAAPPSPAVERDAARYRWLRDDEEWAFFDSGWLVKHDLYGQGSDSLDAFIDAAMVAARAALEGEKP